MDKRRQAEKLIAFLRWLIIAPGLAVTIYTLPTLLIAMLGVVATYSAVLQYCLADPLRFAKNGRRVALTTKICDGLVITFVIATGGPPTSSAHLLYWFVLVSLGYTGIRPRNIAIAAGVMILANAAATYCALLSYGLTGNAFSAIGLRSLVIFGGLLIGLIIYQSRAREDQASERGSHLQAIVNCGARLANFRSVHELAYSVLETAVIRLKGAGGKLLLVNETTNELECEAYYQVTGPEDAGTPSEERLRAYAKWVMSSGREFMVGAGPQSRTPDEANSDDRPAIAAPLISLGRDFKSRPNEGGDQQVLGVLMVWGYPGENLSSDAIDMLRIFSAIAGAAIVNLKLYTNLKTSFLNTLQSLAMGLEARDEYSRGHSDRVTQVSCAIARELDVPPERIDLLRNASLLHDIGKIGVPDAILSKTGKLTAEEWEAMRRHSTVSGEICRPLGLPDEVLFLITHHHERLDGKGYPSGLSAAEQPFLQRILVVADTFDAMRSRRPYRDSMPESDMMAELNKCAGRTLDPTVVDALKKLIARRELEPIYEAHDRATRGQQIISDQDEELRAA